MAKLSDFVSGNQKHQKFTSSGTWTHPRPGDVIHLAYRMAGGGSGGENETGTNATLGGGGGEILSGVISVTQDLSVNIGAGGSGGATGSQNDGTAGGDTDIGGVVTALGGGRASTKDTNFVSDFDTGGGKRGNQGFRSTVIYDGESSTGGTGGDSSGSAASGRVGAPTHWAFGGAESGLNNGAGGGASLGAGGDAGNTNGAAGNGTEGGGGGAANGDVGGGDGGDGVVELFWVE